jgi:uncharacterized protein (TIGR02118 family)
MKKGMIKVAVLYPNGDGKTFDIDYYCNKHMPMVAELLGDSLKGTTVEKGICGMTPGSPSSYAAIGSLYFDTVAAFENSFGPNANAIMSDLVNFSNIEPRVEICEVMI